MSKCFGLYDDEDIIGFISVLSQPLSKKIKNYKKYRRVHRLVILPDYQGIGLGTKLLNTVADYYYKDGHIFTITTSLKNLSKTLMKDDKWILRYVGDSKYNYPDPKNFYKKERECNTYQFRYVGKKSDKGVERC